MELRHLRYFGAVAELCHFGRAAERLHIAQPALSHAIRQLESELDTPLFVRTTRHVALTPAGEFLARETAKIFADVEDCVRGVQLIGAGRHGVLRLGLTGSAAFSHLPRIARVLRRELPGVALEIHSDLLTPAQADGLRGGIIDLALLRPPVPGCGIALRTFDVEPLVVVVPASHRLADHGCVEMRELADEQFVRYGHRDSSLNEAVLRACREAGFAPHTDFEAPTTSVMLGLVAGGFGVALVPAGARAVALEGLTFLDLSPDYRVELALAWNADSDDAVVDAVVGVLGAEYALSGLVEAVGESGP